MTDAPGARRDEAGPERTVFIGSGAFGLPVLDALHASPEVDVVGIVSAPDRPAGRRGEPTAVPIAARARELGLPLLQPERVRTPEAIGEIAALRPGLAVLADYGQIIPPDLLALPPHGILNVHPSLLPRHRGASPIPATILAGDPETGVALIRMDAGLDTGPVIAVSRWPLNRNETAPELEARAAEEGAALLSRTLGPWLRGEIAATPQGEEGATLTRPLRRHHGRLDPTHSARVLERQVRAFQPWPGSFVETKAGRMVIWRAHPDETPAVDSSIPGTLGPGPDLRVSTADGWLVLDEVQPAGGRRMSGPDWLLGRRSAAGSVLDL